MIRVLLVPSSDYLGHPFPQRHNQIFERLHDGKNFEVHVLRFVLFDKPRLKTNLVVHELDDMKIGSVATYYLTNMVSHAFEMRRIIRQESIDIVVMSNLTAPLAYMLIDELSSIRVPVIFDLPDFYPTSAAGNILDVRSISGKLLTGIFEFMLRHMIKRANVITGASHALVEYARRAGACDVVYVPNGISEHFLELHDGKDLREKLGFGEEDIVVGYVGSVEFWLEMKSLVKGIALARERNLPVKLLIVGSGLHTNYSEKVMKWIKQEGLEEYTTQLSFVPHEEVPKYMAGFDVGTIPFDVFNLTAYYAAPNKMWEYLSQMKPVISTPIPEALRNGDCMLMASTPGDYVQEFLFIAQGDGRVGQKVKNGYEKALSMTWQKSAEQFASTLYTLLNRQKRH